jgi:hypothetical protein
MSLVKESLNIFLNAVKYGSIHQWIIRNPIQNTNGNLGND